MLHQLSRFFPGGPRRERQGVQHSLGIGGQQTPFDVVFVEDLFRHRTRRAIVPARIMVVIEREGDDHALADVSAAPPFFIEPLNQNFSPVMNVASCLRRVLSRHLCVTHGLNPLRLFRARPRPRAKTVQKRLRSVSVQTRRASTVIAMLDRWLRVHQFPGANQFDGRQKHHTRPASP